MDTDGPLPPPPPWQPPSVPPTVPAQPTPQVLSVGPAPEPPKKKAGLIIGCALAAMAGVVGGMLLLTGGDDDNATDTAVTTVTIESPVETSSGVPETTAEPDDMLVITMPAVTEPPTSERPATTAPESTSESRPTQATGGADIRFTRVTDDLGFFSVLLPDDLEVDTAPIVSQDDFALPAVSAADDVEAYNSGDTTFGLTTVGVGPDVDSTVEDVLAFLEPGDGVCTGRELNIGFPTALGASSMVELEGCGVAGTGVKVIFVIEFPARDAIVGVYAQSTGTTESLLPFAQSVLESIQAV